MAATDSSPPAPAVVAVVVTRDPGPWLAESLASLAGQDYPNLSILVVDEASAQDPTAVVAEAAPSAFVRRLAAPVGFGRAANEVLGIVEGASHYLFCHDDVALAPDALRLMVEEAFRSNAGIVTPKLVRWDDPQRLLAVGATTDKVGVRRDLVEPGELDQEQHDTVREVLVAPSGATLVRADLFAALKGFGPLVVDNGEDMDLSWRARLCGARVVTAPTARVRHLEAPTCPAPPVAGSGGRRARRAAARGERNRYRTIVTCYRATTLAWVLPLALFWAAGEALTCLLQGRASEARGTLGALVAGLGPPRRLRAAHAEAQAQRRVTDAELRALQVKGNARLRQFVQTRVEGVRSGLEEQGLGIRLGPDGPGGPDPDADGRAVVPPDAGPAERGHRLARVLVVVPVLIVAVFVVGSRSLLGVGLPQIGTLPDTSAGYAAIWRDWWSLWQPSGLGVAAPASPGLALLGVAATVVFGAVGTLGHVVVLGPLLAGPLGMWRAARHFGSAYARTAAAAVYAIVPLPYNALSGGHWGALIVYAGLPWVLSGLVGLSAVVPAPPVALGRVAGRGAGLAILVAAVASVAPSFLYLLPVIGLAVMVGSVLTGRAGPAGRFLGLSVAAPATAFVLLLPWSATVVTTTVALAGPAPGPAGRLGLGQVLRFHTGPYGSGLWEWLLLLAAALPLLVGRSWRLEWAARMWVVALTFFAWAWLGSRGWVPDLPPDVVLVPAAAALAVSGALGVSAFEIDLPGYNFGWRQAAAAASAVALAAAALPWLASAGSGRWDLPSADASAALGFLPTAQAGDYRVLWVGYPAALPLSAWSLQPGVAYATSTDGEPTLAEDWPVGPSGAAGQLAADLRLVESGLTTQIGHILAPAGVLYIVVPNHVGPSGAGGRAVPVPSALLSGLGLQTDLKSEPSDPDYTVYENAAWAPLRSIRPPAVTAAAEASGPSAVRRLQQADLGGARPVLTGGDATAVTGALPGGAVIDVGSTFSTGWRLEVDGRSVPPSRSFGWAMSFRVAAPPGPQVARLGYDGPWLERAGMVAAALLWVVAAAVAITERRRRAGSDPTEGRDPTWFAPSPPPPRPGRPRPPRSSPPGPGRHRPSRSTPPSGPIEEEAWQDV